MNTSATGGYIVPTSTNGDLNDQALGDFLQGIVVGITGMNPTLVRPRWQAEPPNKPSYGTNWAAVGVQTRRSDKFAYVKHEPNLPDANGSDRLYRSQILEVLCSFYGPSAEQNVELLSIGFQIAQNLEAMELAGFGLIEVDDPVVAPELDHERWLYRVDLGFKLRRAQVYDYPVLNLIGGQVAVKNDVGAPEHDGVINWDTVVQSPMFAFDVESEFLAGFDQGHLK